MTDPAPDEDEAALRRDLPEEDPADLYEDAPCGYVSFAPDGRVVRVNRTLCAWTGRAPAELVGRRFADLLTRGDQVFHETNVAPLLRLQGAVREVAVDVVRSDGSPLPCLLNAVEVRDEAGRLLMVRATLFDATSRRQYEEELLAARRAAERMEGRSRTLHQLVSALASAVTVADVSAVVAEHGRTAVGARGAALVLLDDSDEAVRVGHASGLDRSLLLALQDAVRGRLVLSLAEGVREVLLDDRLRRHRPPLAGAMEQAGLTSLVVVPLAADGTYLGVLVLGLGPEPGGLIDLGEADVGGPMPARDLEMLTTLGRQAGQALERARLHEEAERQAERADLLLEAAQLMAEASGVAEAVDRLAELAVHRLADLAVIDLFGDQGLVRPVARHREPDRQWLLDEIRDVHLPRRNPAHPASQALASGRTSWIQHVDDAVIDRITISPRHAWVARCLELSSMLSVPLGVGGGRALGAITLATDRRRAPFTAADVGLAEQLALQVSQVIDKAQRYEREASTSHTLQANLLPPDPPEVPGLSVAVRYLAASVGAEVGGDFYDVAVLPGSGVAVAVGDVVGHDITAAATMGQLRAVYRALLVERPEPSAVIDRLQASWPFLGLRRMATALFATLDPASGRLRIASAGHPPPVLVTDESVTLLPVRPARMLGAPPSTPAVAWVGELPRGATVLLYTDGLVESRLSDIDAGTERLREVVASLGPAGPDELCDALLRSLASGRRDDDVALLALRRD